MATTPILNPKKILLVEDDEFIAELYQRQFELVGCTVELAKDANQAWKLVTAHSYDVVLLDLMLPGRSGMEVLHDLKQLPHTSNVPVIVVSNLENQKVIDEAMSLGALKFITKSSITPLELAKIVGKTITSVETYTPHTSVLTNPSEQHIH
jgi:CheY-like chemotaxis protein